MATPLTIVTAMLGYVGWVRSREYFSYFGLSPALVSYSPQDYVIRSAEVGFGSVVLLALTCAVLLLLDVAVVYVLGRVSPPYATWMVWSLAMLGSVLVLTALGGAAAEAAIAVMPPVTGAVLLAIGAVIVLRFGAWYRLAAGGSRTGLEPARHPGPIPRAAVALAVVTLALAGFWGATVYAKAIGKEAAEAVDGDPASLAVVTVYSQHPLDFPGSNVNGSQIPLDDQQWAYRYTGARLLLYSNARWFLIPEPSSSTYRSSVTILPDTDDIRVEVAVPQ